MVLACPPIKCTHRNQTCLTKSRFELVGYSEWWDHNRDPRKKNSKKTSTVAVVETKTEENVTEKALTLVAAANSGGKVYSPKKKVLNTSTPVSNSAWIIDFGATYHMIDSRQVSPLKPFSQKICFY